MQDASCSPVKHAEHKGGFKVRMGVQLWIRYRTLKLWSHHTVYPYGLSVDLFRLYPLIIAASQTFTHIA
jgi:hypothetical protein